MCTKKLFTLSTISILLFHVHVGVPVFYGSVVYGQIEDTIPQEHTLYEENTTTEPSPPAPQPIPTESILPPVSAWEPEGKIIPNPEHAEPIWEQVLVQDQVEAIPLITPTEDTPQQELLENEHNNEANNIGTWLSSVPSSWWIPPEEVIDTSSSEITNSIPSLETNTTIIETIYEQTLTWSTTTEWNESITVLHKAELTVIIPENTTIRKAVWNEEVWVDQLLLLPNLLDQVEKMHDWQEPTPVEYNDPSLIPETITVSNNWEVALDSKDFTIPNPEHTLEESSSAENTILEDIVPEDVIIEEIPPEDAIKESYLYERNERPVQVSSIIQTTTPVPVEELSIEQEKQPLQEVFEFGLPGEHLLFSEPVTLSYAVPYPEGSRVEILVQHAGDVSAWVVWLATDNSTTCTSEWSATKWGNITEVIWGKVTFFTCGASTFNLIYTWWASAPNFVDNSTKDYTWTVLTWVDFSTWSILSDVDILIDFRPIDNESPTWPRWTTNCYPNEKSFLLIHPDGTQVQLANAGTYTSPNTNCPQAQILYDQSAASGIVWWAWNLTGQSRQPIGNLSTLNGKSPFGTWTLRMGDNTNADGVILFWYDLILKNIECGDGIISSGEACDDGNTDNEDWCTALCTIEAWWECTGEPSICTEIPAPSGLRLHYDGSVAGGLFTDISGNGFDGTQFNGVTTGNQNGETVMCFNGTNQYIQRATNLVTAYPFTMSTWMKSDTTTWLHGVMSFARSTSTNRMRNIEHNGTTIRQNAQNTTATYTNAATTLNTSAWFLVTAVFNSNTDRIIYVNGVLDGTNTANERYSRNNNNRLNIWRFADSSPNNYYDGCVDDVRFYSTALTSWQVYMLYAQPATLTTSTVSVWSPQLTGTLQWTLDTITLTISGNTYTGTNNGDGTRTLNAWVISPSLPNWTYPTTLTVTNPYGRSVQYTSAFTVDIPLSSGDYCIAWPTEIIFPQFTTESYAQTWFTSASWYFELIDSSGADSGYYTTLQITDLSWTTALLANTWIARQSTGIVLLSWTANTGVVLWSAFASWSVASGTVTYIKRDPWSNWWKIGTYWAPLELRLSLPAYIKPDTYIGTITYTLYEN